MWAGCPLSAYSGMLNTGTSVLKQHKEPEGAYRPHPADARQPPEDIETVYSGDIAAVIGQKNSTTGDTPVMRSTPSSSSPWSSPSRVIRKAIEPQDQG